MKQINFSVDSILSLDALFLGTSLHGIARCQLGAPGKATHEVTEEAIEQTDETNGWGAAEVRWKRTTSGSEEVCKL